MSNRKVIQKVFRFDYANEILLILEVVHLYVCGPLEEHTIGVNRYFVLFADEFSRNLWINVCHTPNLPYLLYNFCGPTAHAWIHHFITIIALTFILHGLKA